MRSVRTLSALMEQRPENVSVQITAILEKCILAALELRAAPEQGQGGTEAALRDWVVLAKRHLKTAAKSPDLAYILPSCYLIL